MIDASSATAARAAATSRRTPLLSAVALDTQGLRTDRLVQARLVVPPPPPPSSPTKGKGKGKKASKGSKGVAAPSAPLQLHLTKGRFSVARGRFVGRTDALPYCCGSEAAAAASTTPPSSIVALEQLLDWESGAMYLYLLLREEGPLDSGAPWRLRLCRVEDEEGEEGGETEGRYRLTSQAAIDPPPGGLDGLDGFQLLPGPRLLAWRRFPVPPQESPQSQSPSSYYSSSPKNPPGQENRDPNSPLAPSAGSAGVEEGRGLGIWSWRPEGWTWHPLGIERGQWGDPDGAVLVAVEYGGAWPFQKGEDGVAALLNLEYQSERHAWRAVRLPFAPSLSPAAAGKDGGGEQAAAEAITAAALPLSTPLLPAALSDDALSRCACLGPSALAPYTTVYTVCERTGHPTAWRAGATTPLASVVLKKTEWTASLLRPPTAVYAFLPRPQGGEGKEEEEQEWVAVYHGHCSMGRLCLFRRTGARIHLMTEIRGVDAVLRGDCLGLGWDQLALLPFGFPSSPEEEGIGGKGALATVGVTDGRRLWAFGRCVALPVGEEFDEDDPAYLEKEWVREQPRVVGEAEEEGAGAVNDDSGAPAVKEEEAEAAAEEDQSEEAERARRMVAGVRAALQDQLAAERQAKARAAAAAATAGALLRESERVLAALAYQDVLPPVSGPTYDDSAASSFAEGLVPFLPPTAEEEEEEPTQPPAPRPLFPISRFTLRRRRRYRGQPGMVGLEVKVQAADGLRLHHLALSLFSPQGPLPFTSTTLESLEPGGEAAATLCGRLHLPADLLDPINWRADAVVCCSWQQVINADGDACWPAGAQPLTRLRLGADDLLSSQTEEEEEEEGGDGAGAGLWCVESETSTGGPPVGVVAGPDLAALCAALHQLQQQHHHHHHHHHQRRLRPGPATRAALRQGLAELVAGLKEELDMLCALVEGTAPDPALVRRVWLAQPAQAAAVYLLGLLVDGAGGGGGGVG